MGSAAPHYSWDQRIDRAGILASQEGAGRSLLRSLGALLRVQRTCFESLERLEGLTGSLEADWSRVAPALCRALRDVEPIAPPAIAGDVRAVMDAGDRSAQTLAWSGWRRTGAQTFLERIMLQPYAERLAALGVRPVDRGVAAGAANACPFCGALPQLSIVHTRGDADAGGRQLLCSLCATVWPFRRVVCAACGEEDDKRLAYYRAPEFEHLRVDTCETCRRYLKSVDLTRLGLAVPVVDEIAGAPLDVWAREHGYEKIALNLIGL